MRSLLFNLLLLFSYLFSGFALADENIERKKLNAVFEILAGITELKTECRLDYNLENINELASRIAKRAKWDEAEYTKKWKLYRMWFADEYSTNREAVCIVIRKNTNKWWPDGAPDILK